jgi:hypothetical protein
MTTNPAILDNPALGITESVVPGHPINDHRTEGRQYPYLEPRENIPVDDANRINHAIKKIDHDITQIILADLIGIPIYFLTR